MGLDMYLTKKTYVGNRWKDKSQHVQVSGMGIEADRVKSVKEELGYWRKANAIHNWFVQNVQDGVDECQESYVSKEKLEELLSVVQRVLESSSLVPGKVCTGWTYKAGGRQEKMLEDGMVVEDASVAEELLPSKSGFFFGSTDYDEWYIKGLQETQKILEKAIAVADDPHVDIYYQASW